jgi:hypothetical protein
MTKDPFFPLIPPSERFISLSFCKLNQKFDFYSFLAKQWKSFGKSTVHDIEVFVRKWKDFSNNIFYKEHYTRTSVFSAAFVVLALEVCGYTTFSFQIAIAVVKTT